MGYSTQTDIENIFGAMDVAQWSSFTPGTITANTTRIAVAIALANSKVDQNLMNGPYIVPVVGTPTNPPVLIVNIEATLAGYWLWDTRNLHKVKDEVAEMKRKECEAMQMLCMIQLGRLPIPATFNRNRSFVPRVVDAGARAGGYR